MEWPLVTLLIFGGLLVLMTTGLPVAFCFLTIIIIGVFLLWGGEAGLRLLALSFFASLTSFLLLPIALFILMGEVIFRSGVGSATLDALDKWVGRLPGRLSLLAVAGGTTLSTLTGASVASVAILGANLVPEMESRGYKKPMSLGPILGSGGLAMMIPPSGLAVFIGAIGMISIGKILIAIIVPGLLMAGLYAIYIILRCMLQPSIAPAYKVSLPSLSERLIALVIHILPLSLIVFLVVGVIFIGVATPSEAAALGAVGCFILAAAYRKLNWEVVKESVSASIVTTTMIFMIIVGARAFGQILAFSGVTLGIVELAGSLPVAPIVIFIALLVILLFLGMFMPTTPIVLIAIPVFMPIICALDFNPVWFAVIFLLGLEMAQTTPPYGICLFVMKAMATPDTTLEDCYRAALPFLGCDLIAMALIIAFPSIALWLPSIML